MHGFFTVAAAFLLILFLIKSQIKMSPVPAGRIVPGVFAIKGKISNMFLIEYDSNYIAIDASDDEALVKKSLEELGIDCKKVTHIFLTHSDYDHRTALSVFPEAKIFISEKEEQMINGTTSRFGFFMKNKSLDREYEKIKGETEFSFGSDKTVTLKSIEAQGHTPGHMVYLVRKKGDFCGIFTGDSLNLKNGKVVPFFWLYTMDMPASRKTLKKLAEIVYREKPVFLATAHTGMTCEPLEAFKDFIESYK